MRGFGEDLAEKLFLGYGENWRKCEEFDSYWLREANFAFYHKIFAPLRDLQFEILSCAETLSSVDAQRSMKYGAARRASDIWYAYRDFWSCADPHREDGPLSQDEGRELSSGINTIYINARGLLDNFANALLFEYKPGHKIPPIKISLFEECILKDDFFDSLSAKLTESIPSEFTDISGIDSVSHKAWFNEHLKRRRDQSAHRIPLYIATAVLTPEEGEKYLSLLDEWNKIWSDFNPENRSVVLEKSGILLDKAGVLGQFVPYFAIDPSQPVTPIFPTLVEDMRRLVLIFRCIKSFVEQNKLSLVDRPHPNPPP